MQNRREIKTGYSRWLLHNSALNSSVLALEIDSGFTGSVQTLPLTSERTGIPVRKTGASGGVFLLLMILISIYGYSVQTTMQAYWSSYLSGLGDYKE